MAGIIIYRADERDYSLAPLLTGSDRMEVTTVFSPPALLRAFVSRRKIFFTDRSKRRSRRYYLLAKLLGLRYGRTAEARALLRDVPEHGSLLFVANDYMCAGIYHTYLRGLGLPLRIHCLSRGHHRLPYMGLMWLLARLGLLRGRPRPDLTMLYINPFTRWMPDILLRLYPQARLILRYHDHANTRDAAAISRMTELYRSLDNVTLESFSREDARALGLEYAPNFADAGFLRDLVKTQQLTRHPYVVLICNAGPQGQGRRLHALLRLAGILTDQHIDYDFYVRCNEDAHIPELPGLHLDHPGFTYDSYLHMVAQSSCMVDLCHIASQEGYSYRITEAVLMGKKILTDRASLVEEPFYAPGNILVLDDFDKPELGRQIADFLHSPAVPYGHTHSLTLQAWAEYHGLRSCPGASSVDPEPVRPA